ncbi:PH domain-containing protein [Methanoculleus sp.]|uniref:PH domain-containing protein n=1 Tax=Methanoculleus sp. TaxID=90427 RepID=UPI0026280D19|nr:PH domain-containing protein [Methanoculleus sp.]MDI6866396.1 PH domain-containing protein [Methanoculleus sp.]
MSPATYRIGEEFKPVPAYRTYLYTSLLIFVVVLILPWLIPTIIFAPLAVGLGLTIPLLAIIIFVAWWIPLYCESITYRLTPTEITWERGVWFRQTGIVPYNRITNVDIFQGPLMRFFSFSAVRVQTAGYSAQARAEIVLTGIADPKNLQETIMGLVRKMGSIATEGEPERVADLGAVVAELRAIRNLLEAEEKR